MTTDDAYKYIVERAHNITVSNGPAVCGIRLDRDADLDDIQAARR
jgi:hypothetical protein